jgi:hypothetical protein
LALGQKNFLHKVNVGHRGKFVQIISGVVVIPIGFAFQNQFLENHFVTSQGPGFVREDIFNLPQLFVQIRALHLTVCLAFGRIQFVILAYNQRLYKFYHFDGDQLGNRHKIPENQNPISHSDDKLLS